MNTTIQAHVIALQNEQAEQNIRTLVSSIEMTRSNLVLNRFNASTPDTYQADLHAAVQASHDLDTVIWTWPKTPPEDGLCMRTGLYKRAYAAADQEKVIACAVSHLMLWVYCATKDSPDPILILEQDALLTRKFDLDEIVASNTDNHKLGVVGLNDPRGTTRKGHHYYNLCMNLPTPGIHPIPDIDGPNEPPLPHGLAGNSAYIIWPWAAKELIKGVSMYGLWPNDALMCKQLFPFLRLTQPFYTCVQNTVSSTTT
jgi:GR25 family glycosyltransferase involved in LPS biosynthesis